MTRHDVLRELAAAYKGRPWFPRSSTLPDQEAMRDFYCDAGSEMYYCPEDEDAANAIMERARWPHGPVCPRCGHTTAYRLGERRKFECASCKHQFTVTSDTVFHKLRVPMRVLVGFIALCEAFEWKRGTAYYLSSLCSSDPDVRQPISWPTAHRLWRLSSLPNYALVTARDSEIQRALKEGPQ